VADRQRRFLPDTLISGVFTLLIGVVMLMAASTLIYLFSSRNDAGIVAAATQAADQIIAITRMVDRDKPEDRMFMLRRLNSPTMRMAINPMPLVEESDVRLSSRVVNLRLKREFPDGTEIRVDSRVDVAAHENPLVPEDMVPRPGSVGPPPLPPRPLTPEERQLRNFQRMQAEWPQLYPEQGSFRVSIRLSADHWFNARVLLNLGDMPTQRRPLIFLSIMSLVIGVGALIVVSRAFRPLALFAAAAERLGVDVNAEPLNESGPREVRGAARAFNQMQGRLKRFIQDRTQMLAAISHDLRTPITRLRLRAEFIDDADQREKMLHDLDEMETMIAATLAFARDDAANEPLKDTDVAALVASICADYQASDYDAAFSGLSTLHLNVRPLALKRAITNLVDNAVKYGEQARVSLARSGDTAVLLIEDDGPGIPENERERVFAPFVRLEASRSRETGGTGLGLTIARNIIRGMGGDVEILSGDPQGLRVRVTLPMGLA